MIRNIASEIEQFIERQDQHKNVLIVEGARQVGKTYCVSDVLSSQKNISVTTLNLERDKIIREKIDQCPDFDSFEFLLHEECAFPKSGPRVLFIDEAQESKTLGSFVRFMKEEWQQSSVILTGSSMTRLFDNKRVPVGRMEYIRLYPYSFQEFLRALEKEYLLDDCFDSKYLTNDLKHQSLLSYYDQYLEVGGLPEVVRSFLENPKSDRYALKRLEIYISQKDDFYRKETKLKHHLFEATIRAIAKNLASPFKLTNIDFNHRDAKKALEQMAAWHIALPCEQIGISPTSNYNPKVYLYDVGLAKHFREQSLPQLSVSGTKDSVLRTTLGGLAENAIFANLLVGKRFLQAPVGWRKDPKNPVEVDFILKKDAKALPIEVKVTRRLSKRHYSSLIAYLDTSKEKTGILISAAPFRKDTLEGYTLYNIPIYYCFPEVLDRFFSNI